MAAPLLHNLDSIGIDAVAASIENGLTQREIAAEAGCDPMTLNRWLHANPLRSARARAAMAASAEAWLDRGLAAAESATDLMEVARSRVIAQECARRAAVRNPAYRDKVDHAHISSGTVTVQHLSRAQLLEIAAQGAPDLEHVQRVE